MLTDFGDRENSRVRDLVDLMLLHRARPARLPDRWPQRSRQVWAERDAVEPPPSVPDAARPAGRDRYEQLAAEHDVEPPSFAAAAARVGRAVGRDVPDRGELTPWHEPRSQRHPSPRRRSSRPSSRRARDAMRKDAGLNGDLDRIPQLAWLLFLKAFDGLEQDREVTEADYRPAIEAPYRWRDWAADPNGRTGEALLEFVNGELLPYLRGLTGTGEHDPRDVLAAVFKETNNRMLSGYLLRDVVNKVNEINFTSSDDIHTMAHLYESMLREMRDAAGDSGEFYTPRPVIRFIVQQVDPKLGEIVLDPACGTGGFLVEALEHLAPKVDDRAAAPRRCTSDLRGIEKKPLPYLLGMMNLVLHGVGQPNIVRGNALARADHADQQARPGRRDPHQPAVRRRGGEERSRPTSRPTSRRPRRPGCSCSS